jgi:hypothetical protein
LEKVLERSEKLENLVVKTKVMENLSVSFKKDATKLKNEVNNL